VNNDRFVRIANGAHTNDVKKVLKTTTKTNLGIGVLFLLFACLIVSSVSAADVQIYSGLTPSFSMGISGGDVSFSLETVGENLKTTTNDVTVNTNAVNGYTLLVKSDKAAGKMQEFSGGSLKSSFLTNPLNVALNGDPYVSLLTTDQTLITRTLPGSFTAPIKLKQTTVYADNPLKYDPTGLPTPSYDSYQIKITITGSANP